MKPNPGTTQFHHRYYRYVRMMLRRYPHRWLDDAQLDNAMANKSVRAILGSRYTVEQMKEMDRTTKPTRMQRHRQRAAKGPILVVDLTLDD